MTEQASSAEHECLYSASGGIATITLNRPHRRNAISIGMLRELNGHLLAAEGDPAVRVVVLTGAGKGFCSGLDIKDAIAGTGIGGGGEVNPGGDSAIIMNTRDLPTVLLHEMDTPVIAAINGAAAGYGLDLALGCDMRIMAASARLLPGFAKRGIVPESGGTWYLPRLVGWARAAEISYLGRDLDAAESERLGLVNRVVPDGGALQVAREWAEEIAANAPLAIRTMKRLFRFGLSESFQAHSDHVLAALKELMATSDFQEGLLSFIEQRPPKFEGR